MCYNSDYVTTLVNYCLMCTKALDSYPVTNIKTELLNTLTSTNTIILSAPPGAGKSTVLPLWLLPLPQFADKKIIMLQPRRLATRSVAQRLAQMLNEPLGKTVGYQMRGDSKVSKETRLLVVTEGILTRMILDDNELADVGLIIFDEFHERSIHADLGLALARDVQLGLRDDLTLLLMSATIDNVYLQQCLPDAKYLTSAGKSYPVEMHYQPVVGNKRLLDHLAKVIVEQCQTNAGSSLVFLPGSGEINTLAELLTDRLPTQYQLHCLFGDLSLAEQRQAIAPSPAGMHKVVLATNIAETSITIDGVTLVIDAGLEKVASYDVQTLSNRLNLQQISKASAVQRSGRAGRVAPGRCIRVYSKENFERRMEHSASQISQSDLLPLTLDVARWGVHEFKQLQFVELPPESSEKQCWQLLQELQIVDQQRRLTSHGQNVAKLATHPRYGHMLLSAPTIDGNDGQLLSLACILASLLEERDIVSRNAANSDIRNRLYMLLSAEQRHKSAINKRILQSAQRLYQALRRILGEHLIPDKMCLQEAQLPIDKTGLLLAFAYPERISKARNQDTKYLTANGKGLELDPVDSLTGQPFLLVARVFNRQQRLQVELAAPLQLDDIMRYFPHLQQKQQTTYYDQKKQRIVSESQHRLGQILLSSTQLNDKATAVDYAEVWLDHIGRNGLSVLRFDDKCQSLLTRLRWLHTHFPDSGYPDVSEAALLAQLNQWLAPYIDNITSVKALQGLNFHDILLNTLDYPQQQALSLWVPKYYISPLGRKFAYQYGEFLEPKVALPMQQVYGLDSSPKVANGRVNVVLELLSPAGRPIQITKDLGRFWQGSYGQVQKDMKANYPKHYWPDDPANAKPTNKTKKHIGNGK
ncbi:ATP-dependent helicase HrpB [Thalassotalea sp. HSM 43]|nr:ATP-dependent helicase HrpB [Thalassotalea sp. HSM 43]